MLERSHWWLAAAVILIGTMVPFAVNETFGIEPDAGFVSSFRILHMVRPRRRRRRRWVWHLGCDQGVCSARRSEQTQTILSIPAGQARPRGPLEQIAPQRD